MEGGLVLPWVLPLVPVPGAVCVPFACVVGVGGFGGGCLESHQVKSSQEEGRT